MVKKESPQISFLDTLEKAAPESATSPVALPKVWSVTEIAKDLRDHLRSHYGKILIRGEICDFKGIHRNGHVYMGLKDDSAQIKVVVWKGSVQRIPFDLKMGLEVVISGTIDFYSGGGSLQVIADTIEPLGMGSLQLRFEQLKEKLQSEGLFSASRKKPLPDIVSRIGLITGRSTAALQDMLRIFGQRYPLVEIFFFQASVQGEQAPAEIVQALKRAEAFSLTKPLDLIIIARGGGSYEDLFCFNDERLARAVATCSLPTLSAVGHEIDFTICDFVADHRSATPTHAATESVPDISFVVRTLNSTKENLIRFILFKLSDYTQKLDFHLSQLVSKAPHTRLKLQGQLLAQTQVRIIRAVKVKLDKLKAEVAGFANFLDALSPLKIFERGYAIVQSEQGEVIKSVQALGPSSLVNVRLQKGSFTAEVKKINS